MKIYINFFVIVAVLITACNSSKIQLETAINIHRFQKRYMMRLFPWIVFSLKHIIPASYVMASILSDNIEFYHDQVAYQLQKDILEALKNNICGKVTRELQIRSIEVYPIPGYGAVEMGIHGFHNNQEDRQSNPFRQICSALGTRKRAMEDDKSNQSSLMRCPLPVTK